MLKKLLTINILILTVLVFYFYKRTDLKSLHNCIVVGSYCGFNNLQGGFYLVKDLKTDSVNRIYVDLQDCNIYQVGDTIH